MLRDIVVLGGGSAGFLAAISLKTRLPNRNVTIIRSKDIGIIQVGEGTTTTVNFHLHEYCKIDIDEFYKKANPSWKLGIRFEWGPRPYFNYIFGYELDTKYELLPRGTGYYMSGSDFDFAGTQSGLMTTNNVFMRRPDGLPQIKSDEFTYHLENETLVNFFEMHATRLGVTIIDDTMTEAITDEAGVRELRLKSGRTVTADLFVDASGFVSALLGKALEEPFISFKSALFCDKAVVGGWTRTDEPVKPYTTAETMNAGWCWQIEHETRINRGYVYSSSFITDDEAEREFRTKNPKVSSTRIVKFITGRRERGWVKNVVGVGNAAGFVEPLEATSLVVICVQCQSICEILAESDEFPRPVQIKVYNQTNGRGADTIRDFLALHYKFNNRLDTPFWRECLEKTDLGAASLIVEYYQECGPSVAWRHALFVDYDIREFGFEGYLAMLVGQNVPYRKTYQPSQPELEAWDTIRAAIKRKTTNGFSAAEAMARIRSGNWVWPNGLYNSPRAARR